MVRKAAARVARMALLAKSLKVSVHAPVGPPQQLLIGGQPTGYSDSSMRSFAGNMMLMT